MYKQTDLIKFLTIVSYSFFRKLPMGSLLLGQILLLSGCYSIEKRIADSKPYSEQIDWPSQYIPEESQFFVHNEIDIAATPKTVWEVLIQANNWETYYKGARDLVILNNTTGSLDAQSVFTWNTMGLNFESTIREFEPPYRLSWESNKKSISGYHAWLIIPTAQGSKLITSEAQHGFMTLLQKTFVPNKLGRLHDEWLMGIKHKSENLSK